MAKTSKASPKGYAVYPRLNSPDTKFKDEGEYKTGVRCANDKAAQALIKEIEQGIAAAIIEAKKENPDKAKKIANKFKPYEENEDGTITFNFKARASGTKKKDGQPWAFKPPLLDKYGKPLPANGPIVGGGSQIQVSYEMRPYYTAIAGAGVNLSLKAVMVHELVEYQGGSAESYGFAVEDAEGGEAEDPFGEKDEETSEEDDGSGF